MCLLICYLSHRFDSQDCYLRIKDVDRRFACPYCMWCASLWSSSRWCNAIRARQSQCVTRWHTWLAFRVAWRSVALWFLPCQLLMSKHNILVSTSRSLHSFITIDVCKNRRMYCIMCRFKFRFSSQLLRKKKKRFNSRLEWEENYQKIFMWFNLLAPELLFFFIILAHSLYKMWIKQEPNTLELWNKLHFEGEKTEGIYHV